MNTGRPQKRTRVFGIWYATSKAPSTLGMSSRAQPRYELQGNSGWIYLRRKQACLRVPTLTPEANGDDYYYHLLMLYLPWRNETVSNNDRLLVLGGDQASFAAEVERATCQLRVLNLFGDTVYAPIAPGAAQRNMEMENEGAGPDPIYYDEALLAANHSGALTTDQQGVGEVNYLASDDYLADADDDRTVRAMGMTDAEYRRKVDSLNESQRLAFQKVLNYTYNYHLLETNVYSRKVMVIILVLPTCGEISSQWWS